MKHNLLSMLVLTTLHWSLNSKKIRGRVWMVARCIQPTVVLSSIFFGQRLLFAFFFFLLFRVRFMARLSTPLINRPTDKTEN